MFYVNMVIKGRGRIINFDFKEDDTINNILARNKFKFNPDYVYFNDQRVNANDIYIPMINLPQFKRWQKNVIKVSA